MSRASGILLILLFAATSSSAHPLPNFRFDRTATLKLENGSARLDYRLEVNEWTMVLDGKSVLPESEMLSAKNQREFAQRYVRRKGQLLADQLRLTIDGTTEVRWDVTEAVFAVEADHLKFDYRFTGRWDPKPAGSVVRFRFEDENFEDRSGTLLLKLERTPGLEWLSVVEPTDLANRSTLDLLPGEERRLRRLSGEIRIPAQAAPTPPAPELIKESIETPTPTLKEEIQDRGLVAILDADLGLGVMLLLATLFGAAHAFTPGHGKTMVAAYLVGERGTARHALVLGIVSTLSHTGSVIILAIVLYATYGSMVPATLQGWLTLAGGLLIAAIGFWLLNQRLLGRADHVHLTSGRSSGSFGWWRVILLGIGGGLIPCWDAVLLLLVAIARGRVDLAIPLLLAFSLGLAAVLVGLGLAVVYANRVGGSRFGQKRWFRYLPVLSAAVLMLLGLGFARDGVQTLSAHSSAISPRNE